jgi:hemolysin activation/secretion protein
VRFELKGVRFVGNTVVSTEELNALVAGDIGREVTFSGLQEIASRVTERYRRAGYFLAQALVPPQQVADGVVEISVIEGRLGKIRVERAEGAPISEERIRSFLEGVQPGEPLNEDALAKAMLLLSDLPGITVQSSLEPGEEAGTANLVVEVGVGKRVGFAVDVDNFGIESAGEWRLGATARVASPFGIGDNLDLRAMVAEDNRTNFVRLGYELPVNAAGTRAGAAFANLTYDLGEPFAPLGSEGYARVVDASVFHPLTRSRSATLIGTVSGQANWLNDRLTTFNFSNPRFIPTASTSLTADTRDSLLGGGFNNASAMFTVGWVDFESNEGLRVDEVPGGRDTNGFFSKFSASLSRLQAIWPRFNLYVGVVGQVASTNLDNLQRISIGGPRAVRAYSTGALVADEGAIATAEFRYSILPEVTLSAFYDAGWARINTNPIPAVPDNSWTLGGYGLGLFWGRAGNFLIQGSLAWRATRPALGDPSAGSTQFFVQGVKYF